MTDDTLIAAAWKVYESNRGIQIVGRNDVTKLSALLPRRRKPLD